MLAKKHEFNPVAHRRIALLFAPMVRSGIVLYAYILYVLVKLLSVKFNVYQLAKNSTFVKLMDYQNKHMILVLNVYFFQFTLTTCFVLLLINNYISLGSTLPKSVLRNTNLKGKVAIVTGGYSGIGYETALQLLKWRCKVVICGRNKTRATNAIERMKETGSFDPDNVTFIEMDLDDLRSVRLGAERFLKDFERLDFLINNAGIWTDKLTTTANNLESHFSSNFLGHFYLTKLLLNLVKKSDGRIINVASKAHYNYDPRLDNMFDNKSTTSLFVRKNNTYYGRSKLLNIWFTHALHRRLRMDNNKVLCMSVHPGVIKTKLNIAFSKPHYRYIPKHVNLLCVKRPVDGAATTLHLCATPAHELVSGAYYSDRKIGFVSKHAHNYDLEESLYSFAESLIQQLPK